MACSLPEEMIFIINMSLTNNIGTCCGCYTVATRRSTVDPGSKRRLPPSLYSKNWTQAGEERAQCISLALDIPLVNLNGYN